ncbi:MAG: hypothetical protein KGH87_08910 [Thaumarchaeota archaeon]|nr:hypothetical protein [Nitrososphaerota archaeon]MDE1840024.1 hypothetical protein [Nitrososphaerota archaeon]
MTICKGSKLQLLNYADGKPEEGGCQRVFEVLEYSSVDYESQTQLVRIKVIQ